MKKLCECGCGDPVTKPTNRFLKGHHRRKIKKQELNEPIIEDLNEPIIEELTEEDFIKAFNESIPKPIHLKPGMCMRWCSDCGYEQKMAIKEKTCRNFRCRSKNLNDIDIENYNIKIVEKAKRLMEIKNQYFKEEDK